MGFLSSDGGFWLLVGLLLTLGAIVVGLVIYQVRFHRRAYLGDRLLAACGDDYAGAIREIEHLEEENDMVAGRVFARVSHDSDGHGPDLEEARAERRVWPHACKVPPEVFTGLKAVPILERHNPRDVVCDCGHGRTLHHLEARQCLHGDCTCRKFSAIEVEP